MESIDLQLTAKYAEELLKTAKNTKSLRVLRSIVSTCDELRDKFADAVQAQPASDEGANRVAELKEAQSNVFDARSIAMGEIESLTTFNKKTLKMALYAILCLIVFPITIMTLTASVSGPFWLTAWLVIGSSYVGVRLFEYFAEDYIHKA